MTRRQLVGGPADGRWVTVDRDDSVYLVPGRPRYTSITGGSTPAWEDEFDREMIQYRRAVAPTGAVVFLAPGAVYPERFDTTEWVGREAPNLRDLHHVAPWIWRGRVAHPEDRHEGFLRAMPWEYIAISACGRYKLRQRVGGFYFDDRRLTVDPDEYYTRDIRYKLAYTQLPTCPEFDCDQKAIATVRLGSGGNAVWLYGEQIGYRQRFALCREHARTAVMLSNWLTPGPDVIDREGKPYVDPESDPYHRMHTGRSALHYGYAAVHPVPADLFRITNIF